MDADKFIAALPYSDITTAADKNDDNTQTAAIQQTDNNTTGGNSVSTDDTLSLASVLGLFVLVMAVKVLLFRKKKT
jgi:hypothetical protein